MPYTGDPANNAIDAVRYRAQDIGTPPLLSDAEIQYEIDLQAPLNGADPLIVACFCCKTIAARYATEVSITADGVNYSGEQLQQKYTTLAVELQKQYTLLRGMSAVPISGGTRVGDSCVPGAKPTTFRIGMDDNLRAGVQPGRDAGLFDWDDESDVL